MSAIAHHVMQRCQGAAAYTLYGGYAVMPDSHEVRRFPTPSHFMKEIRTATGRVSKSIATYADGSRLTFRWSKNCGSSLRVS